MKNLIIITLAFMTLGCKGQVDAKKESPLATVIKLQSAEALMNLDEAEKYIDVEKVYARYSESNNPKEEWKKMLSFLYNIGGTNKFTNQFKYFNYDIEQVINESNATVSFISIDKDACIKQITYTLSEIDDGRWKIIAIEYKN